MERGEIPLRVLAVRRNAALGPEGLDRALTGLPRPERDRLLRYRRPEDRHRGVLAAWLARRALAEEVGRPAEALDVRREPPGRPYLAGAPAWTGDFNVSHSGEWVVCALVRRGRVGVDVQEVRAVAPGVARHCCSPEEAAALGCLPPEERPGYLLALWTLKEAVLKAAGVGLAVSPALVGLDTDRVCGAEPVLRRAPPAVGDGWRLWRAVLGRGYELALCADEELWDGLVAHLGHEHVLFGAPGGAARGPGVQR